jgi:hypothetical protein
MIQQHMLQEDIALQNCHSNKIMMKKMIFLLLVCSFFSCENHKELNAQIETLEKQKDSLLQIVQSYENKFVFDNVMVKHYPINNSTVKKGEKYYGEFVFTPYSKDDHILFGTEMQKTEDKGFQIVNPVKLTDISGVYRFEIDIVSDTTNIYFYPTIDNTFSLKHQNRRFDRVLISDKLIAE